LESLDDGTFRQVPMVAIPAHQLWAWTPDVQAMTKEALREYHEGKDTAMDSPAGKKFLRKLSSE